MDLERILALVLFGVLHWILATMLLNDLASRSQVRGRRKAPWALAIIFAVFIGSLLYIACHPGTLYGSNDKE